MLQTVVTSVQRQSTPLGVHAFAIDTPIPGDRLPGAGIEINGWVLGQEAQFAALRAVLQKSPESGFPATVSLSIPPHSSQWERVVGGEEFPVHRPDVATDYPTIPYAADSGFSLWLPLPGTPGPWRATIDAITPDGQAATLAELRGDIVRQQHTAATGKRLVQAPDFVIIGTQRGGTTSLHAYLSAHPLVRTPPTKELHFLTDRFARGRDWYLGQFPTHLQPDQLTGESTPYALFHPLAPQRLRALAPRAKLIALLRNPVDRAYSHYLLERSRGDETLSFADALAAEASRLAGEEDRLLADPTYVSPAHKHASYLARGDYAPQLARWLAAYPRDQLLILRSEDLYERTAETFAHVTDFLGLPAVDNVPFAVHNPTRGPRLDPHLRDRLSQHFAPRNECLAQLLGWEATW